MKNIFFGIMFGMLMASPAFAEDEKIDPATYICAELIAASVDGRPPIYEGLQLDGYNAAKSGQTEADAMSLAPMLMEVSDSCAAMPTDKALQHWKAARKNHSVDSSTPWKADKVTCADYAANPDDGSGFVIWLDAYNRAKTGKNASILTDQATLDKFLEMCQANPKRLMIDVLNESAK